jgi:predicted GIY-YIG superfamily endonuclease
MLRRELNSTKMVVVPECTEQTQSFKLVYRESFETLRAARRRECHIKSWRREKKENLIKYGRTIM